MKLLRLRQQDSVLPLFNFQDATRKPYGIDLFFSKKKLILGMQLWTPFVTTASLANTYTLLQNSSPSVLSTDCYNSENLPFSKEVEDTELGHLFEHLLLDNLCRAKIEAGATSAVFSGITEWNWEKNPYGFFKISIRISKEERFLINSALFYSKQIFDLILGCGKKNIIS